MAQLDCRGMKCPQPILKTAIKANTMTPGEQLEILADCDTFPDDINKWCQETGKVLISLIDNGDHKAATVQM